MALLTFEPEKSLMWGSPVHCRVLSNISGFYPLDDSRTNHSLPLVVTTGNISDNTSCLLGGEGRGGEKFSALDQDPKG